MAVDGRWWVANGFVQCGVFTQASIRQGDWDVVFQSTFTHWPLSIPSDSGSQRGGIERPMILLSPFILMFATDWKRMTKSKTKLSCHPVNCTLLWRLSLSTPIYWSVPSPVVFLVIVSLREISILHPNIAYCYGGVCSRDLSIVLCIIFIINWARAWLNSSHSTKPFVNLHLLSTAISRWKRRFSSDHRS